MRCFKLNRLEDASGVSGTGTVAQGVVFDNGLVALTWLKEIRSITIYHSIEEVEKVHGHEGRTKIEYCTNIG